MMIDEQVHDYATTQAVPPADVAALVQAAREQIDPDDLDPEEGFGQDPHVTILYGFADEQRDPALDIMRKASDLRAKVQAVDVFESDDYDVVILALESDSLSALRDELDQLPNDNEWPEYKPHMTLAYVKKGAGEKYKSGLKSELLGAEFPIEKLEFFGANGDVATVDLPQPADDLKPLHDALPEQSPLFGTDLTEDPEAHVEAVLHPILNRANRRIAHVEPHGPVVSVLLDNGASLDVTPAQGSWFIEHDGETFSSDSPTAIEELVKRVNGEITEQADDPIFPVPRKRPRHPGMRPTEKPAAPPQPEPAPEPAPEPKPEPKPRRQAYDPLAPKYLKKMAKVAPQQPPDETVPSAKIGAGRAPAQPMPQVPQNNSVRVVARPGGAYEIQVSEPVGYTKEGNRFDRTGKVAQQVAQAFPQAAEVRRASVNSVLVEPKGEFDPVKIQQALSGYNVLAMPAPERRRGVLRRAAGAIGRAGKRALGRLGGGLVLSDDVEEDTYTSDVSFPDTIPITKTSKRRRKVKLPGLKDSVHVRRRVSRSYHVRESMSRNQSPILLVVSPDKLAALSSKPVWSALRESGVIEAKPFKMGTDELVEVRIDTLRKEWTQANASVLLDEVGSIDPVAQRKMMEHVDPQKTAEYIAERIPVWCRSVPVELALTESETFAVVHRNQRLTTGQLEEEWVRDQLAEDETLARRALEWFRVSKPVLELLRAIDGKPVAKAASKLLEDETTDPSANLGSVGSGMPTGSPAGATTQGYAEQEPEVAADSSRTWQPGDLFKLHVLVGDSPRWVYREVVGHEGEGSSSVLVYRSDDGRVMQLPHDQIDDAVGFGSVVTPSQFGAREEPAAPPPEQETYPPGMEAPAEGVDEQLASMTPVNARASGENIEADTLRRNNSFAQALTKYQASKDERDWEEVRRQAQRSTGKSGPELDKLLATFGSDVDQMEDVIVDGSGKKLAEAVLVTDPNDERQAEAIRRFTADRDFNVLLDKFHATKNDGYLIRATEQAARVSGMRVADARGLVEELLAAESVR